MSRILLLGQLFVILVASSVSSQEAKPDARLEAIRPYISDNAYGIAEIDLRRIDIDAWYEYMFTMAGDEKFEFPARKRDTELVNDLRDAGANTLYLVAELGGNQSQVYAVLPLDQGANADVILAKALELPLDFRESKRIGNVVVAGAEDVLMRLQTPPEVRRENLAAAWAAAGDAPVKLVVVPSIVQRRAIEEIVLPTLPERWGGGSSKLLTRGVVWASVAIDVPPKLSVAVTVQSEDPKRANALNAFIEAMLLRPLMKHPEVKQILPNIETMVAKLRPTLADDRLTLTLDAARDFPSLQTMLAPVLRAQRATAARQSGANNLKQIGLAMHNYHASFQHFPSQAVFDKNGEPLLSWRVRILPFINESKLYEQFKLDEPWDSPRNRTLISAMPSMYHAAASKLKLRSGKTVYVAPVGPDCMFDGNQPTKISDVTDGLSNTILALELADENAVTWTKPEDVAIDPRQPIEPLVGQYPQHIAVLFGDGSVHLLIRAETTAESWKALLRRSDGK